MEEVKTDIISHIENLVAQNAVDQFTFIHGMRGFQNLKVDTIKLPCCILDYPIISNDIQSAGGRLNPQFPITLLWLYKSKINDQPKELHKLVMKARQSGRDLFTRLNNDSENVESISEHSREGLYQIFDSVLTGCMQKMNVTLIDMDGYCVT